MKKILSKFKIKTEQDVLKLERASVKEICNSLNISFVSKDNTKRLQKKIINEIFNKKVDSKKKISSTRKSKKDLYKFKQVGQNLIFIDKGTTYTKKISNKKERDLLKEKTLSFIEDNCNISYSDVLKEYKTKTESNTDNNSLHNQPNLDEVLSKITDLFTSQTKAFAESLQNGLEQIKKSLSKKVEKPEYKAKKKSRRRGEY